MLNQSAKNAKSSSKKKKSGFLFAVGIALLAFNGLGLFSGLVTMSTRGFDGNDITVFVFVLIFFLWGLYLAEANKKDKSKAKSRSEGKSYETYKRMPVRRNAAPGSEPEPVADEEEYEEVEAYASEEKEEPLDHRVRTDEITYVIVRCKGCNAPNKIVKGTIAECEYCGAPVGEKIE
jgi:hypothetical protein